MRWRWILAVAILGVLLVSPAEAAEAAPPQVESVAIANEPPVNATGATLLGTVNPMGLPSTYRFEYLTEAALEANLAAQPPRDPFAGASFAPLSGAASVGAGTAPINVSRSLAGLAPATAYRYRLRAVNSLGEFAFSPIRPFATEAPSNVFDLLDRRGWDMVSPIEKSGGAVQPPGTISGGGVFQAAGGGGSFAFSSADSFGTGAQGAPSGSQYLATRGSAGWASANITTPLLSGSYGSEPDGVPYQLFSTSLGAALLSNGERCRGIAAGPCPVLNPPLPGSGAPAGYRDYYRRGASGDFESLLSAADLLHTSLGAAQLELRLAAATPDLQHVVLSSCAALTANAIEVTTPAGCDPAAQNLYEWSGGALTLINLLPGDSTGTPGAAIAAARGAISRDGSRVYFLSAGAIYLRQGNATKLVSNAPGAEFALAAAAGPVAYLIDAGELLEYSAQTESLTPVSTGGGVEGVLGASADGSKIYFADSGAVFLRDGAAVTEVASSALASNWLPALGTARVSEDGSRLLFLSDAELTDYPNEGKTEAYLYGPPPGGGAAGLTCVSCSPTGERPQGAAAISGVRRNGAGASAPAIYLPRALSADGNRVFFESTDHLSPQDTNHGVTDVYEWEAEGEGSCARSGGCVQLISGGRDPLPSYFLDADAGGGEAFFLTAASLYPPDPGSYDVYSAREGGGFAVPQSPIPCIADACQVLPAAPEDPTPGTLVPNSGNPVLTVTGAKPKKKKHKKHPAKKSKKQGKGNRGGGR